jgi:hypothetical protein
VGLRAKGETRQRHQGKSGCERKPTLNPSALVVRYAVASGLPIHLPLKPLERSVGFLCANGSRITLTVTRRQEPGDFFSLFCHLGKIGLYLPMLFYG